MNIRTTQPNSNFGTPKKIIKEYFSFCILLSLFSLVPFSKTNAQAITYDVQGLDLFSSDCSDCLLAPEFEYEFYLRINDSGNTAYDFWNYFSNSVNTNCNWLGIQNPSWVVNRQALYSSIVSVELDALESDANDGFFCDGTDDGVCGDYGLIENINFSSFPPCTPFTVVSSRTCDVTVWGVEYSISYTFDQLSPGSIEDISSCDNQGYNPGVITSSVNATPYSSYQWQQSTDLGTTWSDVPNATGSSYDPPSISQTTHYRRKVTDCESREAFSNIVTFVVNDVTALSCDTPIDYDATNAVLVDIPSCLPNLGYNTKEHIQYYEFTPSANETVTIELTGLSADLDLYFVGEDLCSIDCTNYSGNGGLNPELLNVSVNGGTTYYIAVISYQQTMSDYNLAITTPPTAICQGKTVELDATGDATITPADIDNGSSDNCGIASLSLDQTTFTCSDVGTPVTVTLTVTGVNTISSTCTGIVIVEDNIAPTAICQGKTVELDATGDATITPADIDNGSSDNCGLSNLALNQTNFDCSDVGTPVTVTLTVTDVNTNMSTCDATITVEDNIAPTATCQNHTVEIDADGNGSLTAQDIDNGSSDNCGLSNLALNQMNFDCSDVGTPVTVTLTVTDVNTNMSTCDATITVEDNIDPTATCQDHTVILDANGNGSVTAQDIDNGSSDACGILSLSIDLMTFDCYSAVSNTVTLTVTDNNNNSSTCDATVTVNSASCNTVTCGTQSTDSYCYGDNDNTGWLYHASDGSNKLRIEFTAGTIENCCDDITIYDGQDNTAPVLFSGGNGGDLTGLTIFTTQPYLYFEVDSDGSVSCGSGNRAQWEWKVDCLDCTSASGTATAVNISLCSAGTTYDIEVDISSIGSGENYTIINSVTQQTIPVAATGKFTFTDVPLATPVTITIENDANSLCNIVLPELIAYCTPDNDLCTGAIPLVINPLSSCPSSGVMGTTFGATDDGHLVCGNFDIKSGVWYTFSTGANQTDIQYHIDKISGIFAITIFSSVCGATTPVEVYCSGSDQGIVSGLSANQDYLILVWWYQGSEGDFTICLSDPPPPPLNDECVNAIPLTINPVGTCPSNGVMGTTIATRDDGHLSCDNFGINSGVWYTFSTGANQTEIQYHIDAISGFFDIAIFSSVCGAATPVEVYCSFYDENIVSGLSANQDYLILVWSDQGFEGDFTICLSDTKQCPDYQDITGDFTGTGIYSSADNLSGTDAGKIISDQTVKANAMLDYNAGKEVILNQGFEVEADAVFHAYIDGCFGTILLLSPTDPVIGGQIINGNFEEGVSGFTSGANNWPEGEAPEIAIDGTGSKYLNFGELNTGFIVTPSQSHSQVTGLKLWTANDAVERDPASYEIYGINSSSFSSSTPMSSFTLIASGALNLPASRTQGGGPLIDVNSDQVSFVASTSYTSYLIVFPTIKDKTTANSMQIGEVQIIIN